jgi:uncharacterized protein with FMN-binding domain
MRRATAVILGTVTGTALLVGAKVGNASTGSAADDPSSVAVIDPGTGSAESSPSPSAHGKASATPKASTTKRSTPSPTPTAGKTSTKPAAPSGPKDGTYSASAAVKSGRYGTLSMTVTISGSKITKVSAHEDGGETNCYHSSCPKLISETLSAQSASISTVSGATYTSSAYKSALTAVLKSANG